ncbi:MAG TPA: glycosyltransferase family 39 protein [Chitinophagaceae bacterium]
MAGKSISQLAIRYHKQLFYGTWLLLNLIQSASTGLLDDEAYYWVYSRFLDWGYFDHPPMVALLIKAGYSIIPGELGVRLLFAVMSTFSLWLIEKLLAVQEHFLFYTIILSIGLLQIGGIIAIPDTPLIFFTALFFFLYKKQLERPGILISVLFGLSMALLLYSKYHGVLVIIFTLISNPRLFTRPYIYIAGATGLLLFSPHLYWQYINGFPSIRFHLRERNAPEYSVRYTFEYIIGQILLAGPLSTLILWYGAFGKKPSEELERALKFTFVGIYVFFLLFTLKGRVEANWTVPAFIPLVVLSHQYLLNEYQLRKWLSMVAVITVSLVFCVRIYIIRDFFPGVRFKEDEYHHNADWAAAIRESAGGLPVFFTDSYQRAAKYWFYTNEPSFSLNTVDYRRNNYNFWPLEDSLFGKRAYAVYQGKKQDYYRDSIPTEKGYYLGRTIDQYFSFSRIRISPVRKMKVSDGLITTSIRVVADDGMLQHIRSPYDSLKVMLTVYIKDSVIRNIPTNVSLGMIRNHKQVLPVIIPIDLPPGKYVTRFSIPSCIQDWPTMNSTVLSIRVR